MQTQLDYIMIWHEHRNVLSTHLKSQKMTSSWGADKVTNQRKIWYNESENGYAKFSWEQVRKRGYLKSNEEGLKRKDCWQNSRALLPPRSMPTTYRTIPKSALQLRSKGSFLPLLGVDSHMESIQGDYPAWFWLHMGAEGPMSRESCFPQLGGFIH